MARDFADHIKGTFETPFGPMAFALTQGDHVHLSAGSLPYDPPRLTVNGIEYYTSLHLHLQEDGNWASENSSDIHMRRGMGRPDASPAAEKKAYEGIRQAWDQFMVGQDALLAEAEIRNLNNEIGRTEDKLVEAQKVVDELENTRLELMRREELAYLERSKMTRKGGYPKPKDWSPTGHTPEE